ncbi:MAG: UDP-N-acetylmuramate--L-alanine ligase [Chloroflexi bacterium HGW-Chloroflexi-10]|nr:MAG: UDP-N-acetylmuramate--L-alanine ligase [Chloroflexi bacterium HGW-Chloroflexi-10]
MRKHVFFIGIGGYGLSAIARLLKEKGYVVSGSDSQLTDLALDLRKNGVTVYEGHHPDHLVAVDIVVRSSAISDDNPEVQAAHIKGIPVMKRSDFLGEIMQGYIGIGVAGTHGKTTTTAMIAWMLAALDQEPTYIIGGVSKNLGNNAHAGAGKYFVIEADEYDRMFLGLSPTMAVITNIEHDHPDCFPTALDYQMAFHGYCQRVQPQGFILACGDDAGVKKLIGMVKNKRIITYGIEPGNDYQAVDITVNAIGGHNFSLVHHMPTGEKVLTSVELQVPGRHNVRNASAAIAIAHQANQNIQRAARVLRQFTGTGRRFEILGEARGITIIDDYAHHPTEIETTLEGARSRYPQRKIWVVWQPHTFSRTQTLFEAFCNAFSLADHVIVSEIFASREQSTGFSAAQVVEAMHHPSARFIPTLPEITQFLIDNLHEQDVLLVLSAGNANQISRELLAHLSKQEEEL